MSRPRKLLKRALHTGMISASLAASAAFGATRPTQAPIAPQPFTTMPVRALPQPTITAPARRALDATQTITRNLTAGEARLIAQLFGNTVDLSALRISFHSESAHSGNDGTLTLHIHDPRLLSADYSSEENAFLFGSFINQVTALAQQQAGSAWVADERTDGNLYELDGRAFSAYNRAQQRAIVEDYALRFLHSSRQSYWLHRVYGGDKSITDPYLITAVEGAFPTATAARKNNERMILRGLTDGEKEIVRAIFGNQFNTDVVWVHLSPLSYTDVAGAVPSSTEVYFYGYNRSLDYSKEDTGKLSTFIHEMVHIWQFQTERRYTVVVNDIYKYKIEAGDRYESFNIEQQAAMMEDYFLYFTRPDKKTRWLAQSYDRAEVEQRMQYVIAAVEGFLPGARVLRTLGAQHVEPVTPPHGDDNQLVKIAATYDMAPHTPPLPEPPPIETETLDITPVQLRPAQFDIDPSLPALRPVRLTLPKQ